MMIKLFRKIRYDLMAHHKTKRYFQYALGEIILVVIGILIALAINNWKNNRDSDVEINGYFMGILSDLENDDRRMTYLYHFYKLRTDKIQEILSDKVLSNDQLGNNLNDLFSFRKYNGSNSTYLSLMNNNQFNSIKDQDLTNQLIKYYETNYLAWSTDIYAEIISNFDLSEYPDYQPLDKLRMADNYDQIPDYRLNSDLIYKTDYQKLIKSAGVQKLLVDLLFQSNFIFDNIQERRESNHQLQASLKNYTGKND